MSSVCPPGLSQIPAPPPTGVLSRDGLWPRQRLVRTCPHLSPKPLCFSEAQRSIVSLLCGFSRHQWYGPELCWMEGMVCLSSGTPALAHQSYFQRSLNSTLKVQEAQTFLPKLLLPPAQNKIGTMPHPVLPVAFFGGFGRLDSLTQNDGRWALNVFLTLTPLCAVGILKVQVSALLTDMCGFLNQLSICVISSA